VASFIASMNSNAGKQVTFERWILFWQCRFTAIVQRISNW